MYTSWIGKLIGAIAGYYALGIFGIPLGLLIGHWFDKSLVAGMGGTHSALKIREAFFNSAFSVMGHVCKADGRVTEIEIRTAERIIAQMGLNAEQRARAIAEFNRGKDSGFDLHSEMNTLRRLCQFRPGLLNMFLDIQIQAAVADGPVSDAERALLRRIGSMLGMGPFEFARMEAFLNLNAGMGRQSNGGSSYGAREQVTPRNQLADAYRELGVQDSANESEIKKAYRRLIGQNHPDKLAARGLPPEMTKMATEKTQKIRSAYEIIRDARGFT